MIQRFLDIPIESFLPLGVQNVYTKNKIFRVQNDIDIPFFYNTSIRSKRIIIVLLNNESLLKTLEKTTTKHSNGMYFTGESIMDVEHFTIIYYTIYFSFVICAYHQVVLTFKVFYFYLRSPCVQHLNPALNVLFYKTK